jgi:hypothetical protein
MKTKTIVVRITSEQDQILQAKARSAGFLQKSDYIRYSLFMKMPIEEKINAIYERVVEKDFPTPSKIYNFDKVTQDGR